VILSCFALAMSGESCLELRSTRYINQPCSSRHSSLIEAVSRVRGTSPKLCRTYGKVVSAKLDGCAMRLRRLPFGPGYELGWSRDTDALGQRHGMPLEKRRVDPGYEVF